MSIFSDPGHRARSTSTCRSWTGARASRRPRCPSPARRRAAHRPRRGVQWRARARARRRARPRQGDARSDRLVPADPDRPHLAARWLRLGRVGPARGRPPRCTAASRPGERLRARAWRSSSLLPPRGELAKPEYYAHGPDIPRALRAVESAEASAEGARPGARRPARRPRPAGRRARRPHDARRAPADHRRLGPPQQPARRAGAAAGRAGTPLFFVGDLTDRGSPLEAQLDQRRPARGHAAGLRDRQPRLRLRSRRSWPTTARSSSPSTVGCCAAGATADGRGVAGLRVAATATRSAAGGRAATSSKAPCRRPTGRAEPVRRVAGRAEARSTSSWSTSPRSPRRDRGAAPTTRPSHPIVLLVGHTHHADSRTDCGLTVINGGGVGAAAGSLSKAQRQIIFSQSSLHHSLPLLLHSLPKPPPPQPPHTPPAPSPPYCLDEPPPSGGPRVRVNRPSLRARRGLWRLL